MSPIDSSKVGLDMFSYYSRAVADLLATDDEKDNNRRSTGSMLFGDAIAAKLSDTRRERLKSLLRQSLFVLTPQVDEMLEPVMKMRDLQVLLRSNKQQEIGSGGISDSDVAECPPKKLRRSSPASSSSVSAHESPIRDGEVDYYLQSLLKKDSSKVEAIMKKYSDELSTTLENMRQRLEEILDLVMSNSREMTLIEKEQLRKRVLDLPEEKFRQAIEIIKRKGGAEGETDHDDVTLWRLYSYVEALQKAKHLDADETTTR